MSLILLEKTKENKMKEFIRNNSELFYGIITGLFLGWFIQMN